MNKFTKISLNIVAVFAVAMAMSFIADNMHSFFNDWYCKGAIHGNGCMYGEYNHDPTWHWGWRHYLWMLMSVCLFIVQAVRIIQIIEKD